MKKPASIILFLTLFIIPIISPASTPVNTEDLVDGVIYMTDLVPGKKLTKKEIRCLQNEEKALVRFERRIDKIQKVLNSQPVRNSGIFGDPVGKWFWIWLISWGLGILLFVISNGSIGVFLAVIMLLAFVVGSISLVVWLKKQFG